MTQQNHRPIRRVAIGFGLTATTLLQAPAAFAGSLVLTGGSWAFPGSGGIEEDYGISIYEEIVDLAGGIDNAKIGFLAAFGDPDGGRNRIGIDPSVHQSHGTLTASTPWFISPEAEKLGL
ncbi:MAG: hypothetical protein AAGC54_10155 [Cyanobacteria bacterium P01_F01_bin.4]